MSWWYRPRRALDLPTELLALADRWDRQAAEAGDSLIGHTQRAASRELRRILRRYTR